MSTSPSPKLAQLERLDLRAQARGVLRSSIITGDLEPGQLYTIGAFAEKLGVSATPVREALGDLSHLGLVQVVRNRGFIVPPLTDDDMEEILQLRLFLEVPAMEAIAGRLPTKEIASCRDLVEKCKAAARAGDLTQFLEADREFHLKLIGALGNRRLVQILGQLRDETRLYGLRELAAKGLLVSSADEHEVLLRAVETGDADQARELITRHLLHTRGSWAGRVEDPAEAS